MNRDAVRGLAALTRASSARALGRLDPATRRAYRREAVLVVIENLDAAAMKMPLNAKALLLGTVESILMQPAVRGGALCA
ncbi:hypothetical protein [Anaeromyxobacter terrae]|uniref:hypothetical protein n=1 Tax=Anaeromyxobacter terrae TaxID=2925406 RepID=UPI001F564DE4|nr:hypothetical protein [Anaeromyxobacter sp. SG22]